MKTAIRSMVPNVMQEVIFTRTVGIAVLTTLPVLMGLPLWTFILRI